MHDWETASDPGGVRNRSDSRASFDGGPVKPAGPSWWQRNKRWVSSAGVLTLLLLGYVASVLITHGATLHFAPNVAKYICSHGATVCVPTAIAPAALVGACANRSAIGSWMARNKKWVAIGLLSLVVVGYLASVVITHGASMAYAPSVAKWICAHATWSYVSASGVAVAHAGGLAAFKNRSTIKKWFQKKWHGFQMWRFRKGWRREAPVDPFPPTPVRSPSRAVLSTGQRRRIASDVRRVVAQQFAAQHSPQRRHSIDGSSISTRPTTVVDDDGPDLGADEQVVGTPDQLPMRGGAHSLRRQVLTGRITGGTPVASPHSTPRQRLSFSDVDSPRLPGHRAISQQQGRSPVQPRIATPPPSVNRRRAVTPIMHTPANRNLTFREIDAARNRTCQDINICIGHVKESWSQPGLFASLPNLLRCKYTLVFVNLIRNDLWPDMFNGNAAIHVPKPSTGSCTKAEALNRLARLQRRVRILRNDVIAPCTAGAADTLLLAGVRDFGGKERSVFLRRAMYYFCKKLTAKQLRTLCVTNQLTDPTQYRVPTRVQGAHVVYGAGGARGAEGAMVFDR